ncbi:uncharacterized protein CTRU02_210198 [Colletotrichum truncatum]|uniref:Uncharacterized protein n=1 Tax=Colletotrichum truncatum TaxID=5467 RepID=A0ACC3YUR1_COLTU
MHFPSILAILATLSLGVDAAYHCRCRITSKTSECCTSLNYNNVKLGDGQQYCYVNNLAGPLPKDFSMKTCCGGDQAFEKCI